MFWYALIVDGRYIWLSKKDVQLVFLGGGGISPKAVRFFWGGTPHIWLSKKDVQFFVFFCISPKAVFLGGALLNYYLIGVDFFLRVWWRGCGVNEEREVV